jgi:hypothetical protein
MFDSETLRPVIIAMVLFLIVVNFLPKVAKNPIGVKALDDVVMLSVALKGFQMPGAILTGILVYLTNYINGQVL